MAWLLRILALSPSLLRSQPSFSCRVKGVQQCSLDVLGLLGVLDLLGILAGCLCFLLSVLLYSLRALPLSLLLSVLLLSLFSTWYVSAWMRMAGDDWVAELSMDG